jgi:UDP-3-O-[3-hydroxymyristoyl] glucosamine N-acyltransferase
MVQGKVRLSLREVAELVQGQLQGGAAAADAAVDGVGPIETAGPTELAALDDRRFLAAAKGSAAAALLCPPKLAQELTGRTLIVTPVPQIAQNRVIDRLGLWPLPWIEKGVHPTAQVDPNAVLGEGVAIGAFAVVGPRARIGAGTRLWPYAVVEADAVVGARGRIQSGAVIASCATLGDDCLVGHGAVVGGEGFGFGFGPTGPVRLRHIGRVVIGHRVDIGNHVTIDRARFGETRVGDDAKLDSKVHLGHNVVIGARTICAGLTGVAGSSEIGENCLLGGQTGVADHVKIASNCRFGARSGIGGSITEAGDYWGFWARPHRQALREIAAAEKLPDALKTIARLEERLAALEARLGSTSG